MSRNLCQTHVQEGVCTGMFPAAQGSGLGGPINSPPTPRTQPCAGRKEGLYTGQVEV